MCAAVAADMQGGKGECKQRSGFAINAENPDREHEVEHLFG